MTGQQGDSLDLKRRLTPRGYKQAARMGTWLDRHLPEGARVYVSPAQRAVQTAVALGRKYKLREALLPGADPEALLALTEWPHGMSPAVLVGHQPALGQLIAQLLPFSVMDCPVKKGAIWWLRHRDRADRAQNVLVTVQSPEHL